MSQFLCMGELMRSKCALSDLFRFCCQIFNLKGDESVSDDIGQVGLGWAVVCHVFALLMGHLSHQDHGPWGQALQGVHMLEVACRQAGITESFVICWKPDLCVSGSMPWDSTAGGGGGRDGLWGWITWVHSLSVGK